MSINKIDQIKEILKLNNCRITQSRLAVATILLNKKNSFLSSDDIYHEIQSTHGYECDQVSVYRTLSIFEELGLVKKNVFQGDAARYGLNDLTQKKAHHHEHFFKCIQCNLIEPFTECSVSKKEKELEKNGYRKLRHHLEIVGLCPTCAQS